MRRKHKVTITLPGEEIQVGEDSYGDPIYEQVNTEQTVINVSPVAMAETHTGVYSYYTDQLDVFSDTPLNVQANDTVEYLGQQYQVEGNTQVFTNYLTGKTLFVQRIKKSGDS